MAKQKEPTWTTLVLEALRARDDFLDYAALRAATGGNINQITAACFYLRQRNAIGVEIAPDGKAWWYAMPPESDNRLIHQDERVPESKPRRPRKPRRRKHDTMQAPPGPGGNREE